MSATSQNPNQGRYYDASGDVTADGVNQYLYDGEGRICAEASTPVPGFTTMTGYVYDADGNRVAKGTITQFTCDLNPADSTYNGLTAAGNETDYILGPSGEPVTEMAQDANGSMNWQRTYVYAGGALIGTYDPNPTSSAAPVLSFRLTDWLGTMRATTDASGVAQSACAGLPFGDGQGCSGNVPDPHYFTGKERDTESGNDYFEARYYGSSVGRFVSPDDGSDQDPEDPQSWNLYAYVRNNPLTNTDPDGHGCQTVTYTSTFGGNTTTETWGTPDPGCPGTALFDLIWDSLRNGTNQAANAASEVGNQAMHYLQTTDWGCVGKATRAGAYAGFGTGLGVATLALATGPADIAIGPGAIGDLRVAGGATGLASGLAFCGGNFMARSAGGGGGSGSTDGRKPPVKATKLKGSQGWRDEAGNIWKKDMLHKDHWDVSDRTGTKIKEVTFDGRELWPNGPKNSAFQP